MVAAVDREAMPPLMTVLGRGATLGEKRVGNVDISFSLVALYNLVVLPVLVLQAKVIIIAVIGVIGTISLKK